MWSALISLIGWLGGASGIIAKAIELAAKAQDVDLEKFRTQQGVDRDAALKLLDNQRALIEAHRDLSMVAMNHPLWWAAWLLFVLPVGLYHALIFVVSTLDLALVVRRVPPVQEEWAMWIVISIFGAQGAAGITAGILGRFVKR